MPGGGPGVSGVAWMPLASYPGSVRVGRIHGRVFSVQSILDVLIDHTGQLLAAIVIPDDFVAWRKILAHAPHLNDVIVLELMQSLLRPIGTDELNVGVYPGEVLRLRVLAKRVRD